MKDKKKMVTEESHQSKYNIQLILQIKNCLFLKNKII